MPAWVTITLTDVAAFAQQSRLDAAWNESVSSESTTWFSTMRDALVARIRAKIATCDTNQVDATEGTIPPEFKTYACLKLLSQILARPGAVVGGGGPDQFRLTEDQRSMIDQAERDLDAVAKCELAVTAPETAATSSGVQTMGGGVSLVSSTTRRFTRTTLNGL